MSIVTIPRQPLVFKPNYSESDCNCADSTFVELMSVNDTASFQFKTVKNSNADPLTYSSEFIGGTWSSAAGIIDADGGIGSYSATYQNNYSGSLFLVEVDVLTAIKNVLTVQIFVGGVPKSDQVFIQTAGSYSLYMPLLIQNDIPATVTVLFTSDTGAPFEGTFTYRPIVYVINVNYIIGLYEAQTNLCVYSWMYGQQPVASSNLPVTNGNYVTINQSVPEEIANGCYYWGITDADNQECSQVSIINPQFLNGNDWTAAPTGLSTLIWGSGGWSYTGSGATLATLTSNESEVCEGVSYEVFFKLSGVTGTLTCTPILGGVSGTSESTNGEFTSTIIAGASGEIVFRFQNPSGNPQATLDYFFVRASTASVTPTLRSQSFSYAPNNDCTTYLFEGCCGGGDIQFNFDFSGGFYPRLRLGNIGNHNSTAGGVRYFKPNYENDASQYRTASGLFRLGYADQVKTKLLRIERVPERVHDFLSILVIFDSFFVEGNRYVTPEGSYPAIDWIDADDLGTTELQLIDADISFRKIVCNNITATCEPTTPPITDEDGAKAFETDEFFIYENGSFFPYN